MQGEDGVAARGANRWNTQHTQRYHFCHHAPTATARVTQPPSASRAGCGFLVHDQILSRFVAGSTWWPYPRQHARSSRGQTYQGTENMRCQKQGKTNKQTKHEDHVPRLWVDQFLQPSPAHKPQLVNTQNWETKSPQGMLLVQILKGRVSNMEIQRKRRLTLTQGKKGLHIWALLC